MGYAETIVREIEELPIEKQTEILDFIAFLHLRQSLKIPSAPKTELEVKDFFRSFKVDLSEYKFDRDEANAR